MSDKPGHVLPTKSELCGQSVDFDWVTHNLEEGNTSQLRSILGCRQAGVGPADVLKTIQTINEQNRQQHPKDNLPKLSFETGTDWPSSWGTHYSLNTEGGGHKSRELYDQINYSDGTRRVTNHHPDYYKRGE